MSYPDLNRHQRKITEQHHRRNPKSCGICGDTPSKTRFGIDADQFSEILYALKSKSMNKNQLRRFRICDDCTGIRVDMYGEIWLTDLELRRFIDKLII